MHHHHDHTAVCPRMGFHNLWNFKVSDKCPTLQAQYLLKCYMTWTMSIQNIIKLLSVDNIQFGNLSWSILWHSLISVIIDAWLVSFMIIYDDILPVVFLPYGLHWVQRFGMWGKIKSEKLQKWSKFDTLFSVSFPMSLWLFCIPTWTLTWIQTNVCTSKETWHDLYRH